MKRHVLNYIRKIIGTSDFYLLRYDNRRYQLIEHILHETKMGITNEKYVDHDIIVSLTTYGKRINDVAFTIESIMEQTMKANRIILWLDHSFEQKQIPKALVAQQKRGLEIAYCDDIRSYTKLIPSLRMFPNDTLITIDDDVIYDYDVLEHLITSYKEDQQSIHCCRCKKILFQNSTIKKYNKWPFVKYGENDKTIFFTGVGGVLYPPRSLDVEVLNESVFMDICKYGDDIWFNAMAQRKGTRIKKVYTRNSDGEDYIVNPFVQDIGLFRINVEVESMNDKQIKSVFSKYGIYINSRI